MSSIPSTALLTEEEWKLSGLYESLRLYPFAKYFTLDLHVNLPAKPSFMGIRKHTHYYANILVVDGHKTEMIVEKFRLYGLKEDRELDPIRS